MDFRALLVFECLGFICLSIFRQDQDVVFLETSKQLKRQHHMITECIPMPKEEGGMAPIYFKVRKTRNYSHWNLSKANTVGLASAVHIRLQTFSYQDHSCKTSSFYRKLVVTLVFFQAVNFYA